MKTRVGFVSNSSSSSFVIAAQGLPDVPQEILDQYPFLKSYLKSIKLLFNDGIITTKDGFDEWFIKQYGAPGYTVEKLLEEDEYYEEIYYKAISYLAKGYSIFYADIERGDSAEGIIESLVDGANFIYIVKGE